MKNIIREIVFGKNTKISGLLILGILMVVGLGCFGGRNKSSTPIPAAYYGDWQGQDGTTISIRADGKGDYHSGGTKVDGGTAEVNEADKTLSITFFGIGKTLKIDEPPAGDRMKLDGIEFRRKGGFTDSSTSNSSISNSPVSNPTGSSPTNKSPFSTDGASNKTSDSADRTSPDGTPPNSEVETLVKETMSDFASGVEQDSFGNLRSNASKDFQATFTTSQLNTQFQVFIDKKDAVLPILKGVDDTSANFSAPPRIRTEKGYKILVANGEFPTSPRTTMFETEYELEKGRWKLLTFKIKM